MAHGTWLAVPKSVPDSLLRFLHGQDEAGQLDGGGEP